MSSEGLGNFVRQRRMDLGLTQEQLAELVGQNVTQAEISRLERGYVVLPRRDRLDALATALQVSLGMLLIQSGWLSDDEAALVDGPSEVTDGDDIAADEALLIELRNMREDLLVMIERIVQLENRIQSRIHPAKRPDVTVHTGVFNDWELTTAFV
jgi:transcriptional regulator with XRE-family HTH domain